MSALQEHVGRVSSVSQLTPKILHLCLDVTDLGGISFRAGQFLQILIAPRVMRQYSIASSPSERMLLDLCVDISPGGVGSTYMSALRTKDTVRFRGPFGVFTFPEQPTHPITCVATGAGIAPIRSMIVDLLEKGSEIPIELLFGNRSEEFLFYHEDFQRLAGAHPTFRYIPLLSQAGPAWPRERGRVTELLAQRTDLSGRSFYLCGSPGMVDDTRKILQEKNIQDSNVHFEKFF